ncbi:hypothetical protein [Azohydromonas caseinilytica]|uniref:Right handed beta helix region n=1 Tax=Azohydromonas caseinilytica TaxID=2728836 RepID=A0A848F559_9BURK|nr:hypothetical protein [Azohydromonas caseinilytica]NML13440.1 hypothetical protein [Azohydromonas caseinilytica]
MRRRELIQTLALAGVAPMVGGLAQAQTTGTVRQLYPGMSLAALLAASADGDTIEVMPGTYRAQVGVITQRVLTIRGVGSTRPVFQADGVSAEGKGILVVRQADNVRIENLEFRGARVPDLNGAGIRFERGRLTVGNCAFVDNEMGILTGNDATSELEVINSDFGYTGRSPAATSPYPPHQLYAGRIKRLTMTGCYFHDGYIGHLLKSRARENVILYNQLVDSVDGKASYEMDFPEGGLVWAIGNVIGQSPLSPNSTMLSYGAETSSATVHGLYLSHNTFVNDRSAGCTFVRVGAARLAAGLDMRFVNNLLLGTGDVATGSSAWVGTSGNFKTAISVLQAPWSRNYRLVTGSPLRGKGVVQGSAGGRSLVPTAEFKLPLGTVALASRTTWSPGAYQ